MVDVDAVVALMGADRMAVDIWLDGIAVSAISVDKILVSG